MNEEELNAFRARRLSDLLRERFDGNKVALGKALGYSSGAFVRQMIDGDRAVSEKTVLKIHALHGCKGWMDLPAQQTSSPSSGAQEHSRSAPEPIAARITKDIQGFMAGLDPLLIASAKDVIRQLMDQELDERQATEALTRLQTMSSATTPTKRTGTG